MNSFKKIQFNKVTWYSKLIALILFVIVIPAWMFYLGVKYQQSQDYIISTHLTVAENRDAIPPEKISTKDWKIYTNDQFGFSIQYPPDWKIYEDPASYIGPVINIYEDAAGQEPPFTHHTNVTQVSIFPEGVPTEGPQGQSQVSNLKLPSPTAEIDDFILSNGNRWGTLATFTTVPSSWKTWGFVWTSIAVKDLDTECYVDNKKVSLNQCDTEVDNGGEIKVSGAIDPHDRQIEDTMLQTFKFTK